MRKHRFPGRLLGEIIRGRFEGDIVGNVTGNVTGNLTGDVTGDTTGQHNGALKAPIQVLSADGAITIKSGTVFITKGSVAAITLADPVAADDGKALEVISTTAFAHTVTIAGGLNGGGASADVGTFGAAVGNRFSVKAYNSKWWVSGAAVNVTFA